MPDPLDQVSPAPAIAPHATVAVLYVGTSLLGPLRHAESAIRRESGLALRLAAYNLGAPLEETEWRDVERDVSGADVVFIIHVTDGENAARLMRLLDGRAAGAIVVINCMADLMRRLRLGKLRFTEDAAGRDQEAGERRSSGAARRLFGRVGSWMTEQARGRQNRGRRQTQYLRLIERLPALLKLVPPAGRLRDVRNYLYLFTYFLQPTPDNIRAMLLYALKHYARPAALAGLNIDVPAPETAPAVALYHPDAPELFQTFEAYRRWYLGRAAGASSDLTLDPERTVGLLLMRTQIVSRTRGHYDGLIRAVEREGLSVIPAISTFMDNREACELFLLEGSDHRPRVSQLVSLTGFSFVGGPARNDSEAAVGFLRELNRPFRSAVSLDVQHIEAWQESWTGLNPVQAGMQIAIPEIDGATEPFVYGGMPAGGSEPVPLDDRCERFARRLRRWNRLRTADRSCLKLAVILFCFPPGKGNTGTAAELDVFPSLYGVLARLKDEGYTVNLPSGPEELRELLLGGNSGQYGTTAHVAYRLKVEEYRRLCPYVEEIEAEWGRAPGRINSFAGDLLIQGLACGNVFVGVQPTFGYEGDPVRLLMSRSGAPHHGFMALYTYLEKIFGADAVLHIGTHGALEFMPGKQVGLSSACWPDRLVGELPHIYLYSVNNPSEGTIAKRRSYAELISYLTPPLENAGLYRDIARLRELLQAYRATGDEGERARLFETIRETAAELHFTGLEA